MAENAAAHPNKRQRTDNYSAQPNSEETNKQQPPPPNVTSVTVNVLRAPRKIIFCACCHCQPISDPANLTPQYPKFTYAGPAAKRLAAIRDYMNAAMDTSEVTDINDNI